MQRIALVLFAILAMASTAQAQSWPNAKPSPYGAPGQGTAPAPATAIPAPTAATGTELGAPPHALGGSSVAGTPSSQAALPASNAPAVPDLDNPESGRATAALNVLEAQGYASFSNFGPSGNAYTALVTDHGQQFRVVINPDTGQISRQ
ncbi:MAG: hypothetical protein KGI43_01885 [Alphaproteobacteria bacterium]|nr:hypothetical protein [Alphaproteobacteria bacterium]